MEIRGARAQQQQRTQKACSPARAGRLASPSRLLRPASAVIRARSAPCVVARPQRAVCRAPAAMPRAAVVARAAAVATLLAARAVALAPTPSVLVVGGSGRVGASTVRWLDELSRRDGAPLALAIGGRSRASFDEAAKRLRGQGVEGIEFVPLDLEDSATLERAVAGRDLVVHTAGPFQQREDPALLRACIDAKVPYCDARVRRGRLKSGAVGGDASRRRRGETWIFRGRVAAAPRGGTWIFRGRVAAMPRRGDAAGTRRRLDAPRNATPGWGDKASRAQVCDELELSRNGKALAAAAAAAGVPAVLSCGIWPGASALMAAEAVERLGEPCDEVVLSFHTAGTGGAGPTIVSATFLLLCTEAAVYDDGACAARRGGRGVIGGRPRRRPGGCAPRPRGAPRGPTAATPRAGAGSSAAAGSRRRRGHEPAQANSSSRSPGSSDESWISDRASARRSVICWTTRTSQRSRRP